MMWGPALCVPKSQHKLESGEDTRTTVTWHACSAKTEPDSHPGFRGRIRYCQPDPPDLQPLLLTKVGQPLRSNSGFQGRGAYCVERLTEERFLTRLRDLDLLNKLRHLS